MAIFNQYKNIFNELVNSLDNSLDTKPPRMLKQIDISNNDIPGPRNSANGLKETGNLLNNGSQEQ